MKRVDKRDKLSLGMLIGFSLPLFAFIMVYLASGSEVGLGDYAVALWKLNALMPILSICVLPNLLFFALFNKMRYALAMRGILVATISFALLMLANKLL